MTSNNLEASIVQDSVATEAWAASVMKKSRMICRIAGMVVLLFFLGIPVAVKVSAAAPPGWWKSVSRERPGNFPPLKPCKLGYVFSWSNVVKAGQAEVVVGREEPKYPGKLVGKSSGGSRGVARALWPYDHSFTSVIEPTSLGSVYFSSTEVDRKEKLVTTNVFRPSGVAIKSVAIDKESGKKIESTGEFPVGEARDLMSAFLYARSQPLKTGDEIVILTHPFGSAYLGKFKVLGREKHKIGLGEFDAIKLDVDVSKVQSDLRLKNYSKFKRATMWVSDDEFRVPLEVRAEIFVGSIRATLTDRVALGAGEGTKAAVVTYGRGPEPEPAAEKSGGGLRGLFKRGAKKVGRSAFGRR